MYGEADKTEAQIKCDEKFIIEQVELHDTPQKACDEVLKIAWHFYYDGDHKTAIKRFNQAWLLNKENPGVYWGFGAVLNQQGEFEQATKMGERALELAPINPDIMADLAFSYGNKARHTSPFKGKERNASFIKSYELFEKSVTLAPDRSMTYYQWAIVLYYDKEYEESWKMVDVAKEHGHEIHAEFLKRLSNEYLPKRKGT